jgi:hypothetical protein
MSELAEQWSGGHKRHSEDRIRRLENARKCLRIVARDLEFRKVIDFGCGIGGWLQAAKDLGASEVLGIEGEYIRGAETIIPQECIETYDLSAYDHDWQKRFDFAMTIEVAEHLPESSADRFCNTLINASDFIIFSAARAGQTGIGHVNEKPLGYWVKKFWELEYVPLERFRPYIASDKSIYPWLRMNLVMFVNYAAFLSRPDLHRFARPLADFDHLYPG